MTAVIHEILLPERKPDFEWVRGRARQKMSPASVHSFVQAALLRIVGSWAREHGSGQVGPEWRVRILPAGSIERRPLTRDRRVFFAQATRDDLANQREGRAVSPTPAGHLLRSHLRN